jgi:hypothetical protein
MDIVGNIQELSELFSRPGGINLINGIDGLTRGQMVSRRSDAADPGNDSGKFFHRPS